MKSLLTGREYRLTFSNVLAVPRYTGTLLAPHDYADCPAGWWVFEDAEGTVIYINPSTVSTVRPASLL